MSVLAYRRTTALLAALVLFPAIMAPAPGTAGTPRLQHWVEQRQYLQLERDIQGAQLSTGDSAFFHGILANRKNRVQESIRLLAPMVPELAAAPPSWREKELLKTLGDDYNKVFDYAGAERMFSALLQRYSKSLTVLEHRIIDQRSSEMRLLRAAPPQTVETSQPAMLPATRNQLGLLEVPVEANGKTESWLLDTGANTSVVTETTARRIGLQLLEGTATTDDVSGLPVQYRVGVLPLLKIGNTILHNVELPVTSDKNFNLGGYQIQGIIGFPVQAALGSITVYADGHVGIGTEPSAATASELFMEGQSPLLAAQLGGAFRLFTLDTGATGSNFSRRLYQAMKSGLPQQKSRKVGIGGAGGSRAITGRDLGSLTLEISGQKVLLKKATAFTEATGSGLDDFFGNLGQDVLRSFKSYTIDFNQMKFTGRKANP